MDYHFTEIGIHQLEEIKALFVQVFTAAPWNDNWSDEKQLEAYLRDLVAQSNSLTFGLYEGETMIGLSMGHIRHWYSGTEYYIDELCIRTETQGKGAGTFFLKEVEKACREQGFDHIFLLTDRDVAAYEFYTRRGFYELKKNVALVKKV